MISFKASPPAVRATLELGYRFCRAAAALTDVPGLAPQERLKLLETFWNAWDSPQGMAAFGGLEAEMAGSSGKERALVRALPKDFMEHEALPGDERALIRDVVAGVLEGFRAELLGTVESEPERYASFIGGKPREFGARLCVLRMNAGGANASSFIAAKLLEGQSVVKAGVKNGDDWNSVREAAWKAAVEVTRL